MTGRVVLVGAGPGDPELITVKGGRALAAADVVVYDRLVAPALLDLAPRAERVYVGKEPGRQAMSQHEIGALLVREASAGREVVRLKGGDPFVFGRGGEELMACAEAGVPVDIVPGVTSAVAAPAAAGIPLTHRGLARSFAVVTASTAHAEDTVDLARMATATDTLVVLMASGKLAETCLTLIDAGRPPSTPAAIVQWAWTEDQRTITGSLAELPTLVAAANVGPPATLVVGDVVSVGASGGGTGLGVISTRPTLLGPSPDERLPSGAERHAGSRRHPPPSSGNPSGGFPWSSFSAARPCSVEETDAPRPDEQPQHDQHDAPQDPSTDDRDDAEDHQHRRDDPQDRVGRALVATVLSEQRKSCAQHGKPLLRARRSCIREALFPEGADP